MLGEAARMRRATRPTRLSSSWAGRARLRRYTPSLMPRRTKFRRARAASRRRNVVFDNPELACSSWSAQGPRSARISSMSSALSRERVLLGSVMNAQSRHTAARPPISVEAARTFVQARKKQAERQSAAARREPGGCGSRAACVLTGARVDSESSRFAALLTNLRLSQ